MVGDAQWPHCSSGSSQYVLLRFLFRFDSNSKAPFSRAPTDLKTNLSAVGHAGAVISGGKGKAEDKVAALEKAGVVMVDSPSKLGSSLKKAMQEAGLV
jgi:hypothetical protein